MSKDKTYSIKEQMIVILVNFIAWVISYMIWSSYTPNNMIMLIFMTIVCVALVCVPYILLSHYYVNLHEEYITTKPNGFYATLGGSVIAGSMVITLLFPATFLLQPIALNTVIPSIVNTVLWKALVPAIGFEIFFRGTLQAYLSNWIHKLGANAITSIIFSIVMCMIYYHQFSSLLFFALFVESLALGAVFSKSKSIWTSSIMHALILALLNNGFFYFGDHYENIFYSLKLTEVGDVITGGSYGIIASFQAMIGFISIFAILTLLDAIQIKKENIEETVNEVKEDTVNILEQEYIEEEETVEVSLPPLPPLPETPQEQVNEEISDTSEDILSSVLDEVIEETQDTVEDTNTPELPIKPLAERTIEYDEAKLPPLPVLPPELPNIPAQTDVEENQSTEEFDVSKPMTPEDVRRAREAALRHYQKH